MFLTRLILSLIVLAAVSYAHITGTTGPARFRATANSEYPLTFTTINGPITNEDFSVAVGLQLASSTLPPPALGSFVHNFDLENTGHGSTGNGNFTLSVPLPSSRFSSGPGKYVLTSAVTNAVGAAWSVQLLFFNTEFMVHF